jgi:large conductance mechanosensitive channel
MATANSHKSANNEDGGEVIPVRTPGRKPRLAVFMDADDVVEKHVHGFANFLREYGVVGLAVGFVAGFNVNSVVKQLVDSFITPLVQLFFGKTLDSRTSSLTWHDRTVQLAWGKFVYVLINFLFILITVYLIIKIFRLDRFKKVEKVEEKKK